MAQSRHNRARDPFRLSLRDEADIAKQARADAKRKLANVQRGGESARRRLEGISDVVAGPRVAHEDACAIAQNGFDFLMFARRVSGKDSTDYVEAHAQWMAQREIVTSTHQELEAAKQQVTRIEREVAGYGRAVKRERTAVAEAEAECARLADIRRQVVARRKARNAPRVAPKPVSFDRARLGAAVILDPAGNAGPAAELAPTTK